MIHEFPLFLSGMMKRSLSGSCSFGSLSGFLNLFAKAAFRRIELSHGNLLVQRVSFTDTSFQRRTTGTFARYCYVCLAVIIIL